MRFVQRVLFGLMVAVLGTASSGAWAQLVAGRDYRLIKPQPAVSTGRTVEVKEFFSYACPHCDHFQPSLHEWLAKKPADVEFRRQPVIFNDSWIAVARTYYAIETIGQVDKLHADVFTAIHAQKKLDPRTLGKDPKPLFDWIASKGVDRQKFVDAYNSFSVDSKVKRTQDISAAYEVDGTPTVVIDGRYLTSPSMIPAKAGNVDYPRFFAAVDTLIAMARASRSSAKSK